MEPTSLPLAEVQKKVTDTQEREPSLSLPQAETTKLYRLLLFLRVFSVFIPQYGYIHPDELIQSVEVVGGKILAADATIAWEFDARNPVRSLGIPFLVQGAPIWLLRYVSTWTAEHWGVELISPYSILVSTRLVMCASSFLVDHSLAAICRIFSLPADQKLTVLASSYVMFVYATRTFSNALELVLFSVLLRLMAAYIRDRQIHEVFAEPKAEGVLSPAKSMKVQCWILRRCERRVVWMSLLVVIGLYNRPTFLVYAVAPAMILVERWLEVKEVRVWQLVGVVAHVFLCTLPVLLAFVLSDSIYYREWNFGHFWSGDYFGRLVFPPWNFVVYNTQRKNLLMHAMHGKYQHLFINIFLLFGTLGVIMLLSWVTTGLRCMDGQGRRNCSVINHLMFSSIMVPLILLSVIPNQQPRFIIPLILPVIFLYGDRLFSTARLKTPPLFISWLAFNVVMTLIYGLIHQGGVVSFASYLHKHLDTHPDNATVHIFTSHMYNFPRVLLNRGPGSRPVVHIHEECGKEMRDVVMHVNGYRDVAMNTTTYLAIPSALRDQFEMEVRALLGESWSRYRVAVLGPHLSTEVWGKPGVFSGNWNSLSHTWRKIIELLSVTIYQMG